MSILGIKNKRKYYKVKLFGNMSNIYQCVAINNENSLLDHIIQTENTSKPESIKERITSVD